MNLATCHCFVTSKRELTGVAGRYKGNHCDVGASVKKMIIALLCSLSLSACGADSRDNALGQDQSIPLSPSQIQLTSALTSFESCDPFLRHVKANALDMVGPWGVGGGYFPITMEAEMMRDTAEAIADESTAAPKTQYSTTNIQEAGVDEPDIIKTDGQRIVALVENKLRVLDATGEQLRQSGELQFDNFWAQDMFLSGDRVVVFGQMHETTTAHKRSVSRVPGWYSPITTLISVDISKPTPQVTRRLHIDGSYISSRLVDNSARIVIQSSPTGLEWFYPEGSGLRAEREAEEKNRQLIKESTVDNWVPWFVLETSDGALLQEGTLTSCERVYHPSSNSGLQMLNIVTVDLDEELFEEQIASTSVLADGRTVYSSRENMYVATTEWVDERDLRTEGTISSEPPKVSTRIHKFDISDPTRTVYRSSGQVIGTVLNQYSMSEFEDNLRVATTDHGWWTSEQEVTSQSYVTVLQETDDGLTEIGRVGNLGKGERIYAVRFLGDLATVVTFRQTDPLYTVDLSQPQSPKVLGELKIMGYSAYLHPITDKLLIGVGQDALETGRTIGTQVSLFDISDLSQPVRIDQWQLPGGSSETEYNARAFLHWPAEDLFVLPVVTHQIPNPDGKAFAGAVALELNGRALDERGRITHLKSDPKVTCQRWIEERENETEVERQHCWSEYDWRGTIQRSLVIDDQLHTLSSLGVLSSDLKTMKPLSFLAF